MPCAVNFLATRFTPQPASCSAYRHFLEFQQVAIGLRRQLAGVGTMSTIACKQAGARSTVSPAHSAPGSRAKARKVDALQKMPAVTTRAQQQSDFGSDRFHFGPERCGPIGYARRHVTIHSSAGPRRSRSSVRTTKRQSMRLRGPSRICALC